MWGGNSPACQIYDFPLLVEAHTAGRLEVRWSQAPTLLLQGVRPRCKAADVTIELAHSVYAHYWPEAETLLVNAYGPLTD
jgi:hypothetical protein